MGLPQNNPLSGGMDYLFGDRFVIEVLFNRKF